MRYYMFRLVQWLWPKLPASMQRWCALDYLEVEGRRVLDPPRDGQLLTMIPWHSCTVWVEGFPDDPVQLTAKDSMYVGTEYGVKRVRLAVERVDS